MALIRVCKRLVVELRLNTAVKSTLTSSDSTTATGVELSSDEKLTADIVIVNADLGMPLSFEDHVNC